MLVKLEWLGYRMAKKTMTICQPVFIWYRNVSDRQTDGQTDGRTDRIVISISRVSRLTRDKNDNVEPFRYNTGAWQTDRHNCYVNIARQHGNADARQSHNRIMLWFTILSIPKLQWTYFSSAIVRQTSLR